MRYTADELARLAGLSPRTVRYYVAEGLLSGPLGKGRGSHFDGRHLSQLRRVRLLQSAGLDNRSIREHAEELERILRERGLRLEDAEQAWGGFARQAAEAWGGLKGDPPEPVDVAPVVRVRIAPDLELLVGNAYRLPDPARMSEVVRSIKTAFVVPVRPTTSGPRSATASADDADEQGGD